MYLPDRLQLVEDIFCFIHACSEGTQVIILFDILSDDLAAHLICITPLPNPEEFKEDTFFISLYEGITKNNKFRSNKSHFIKV